jgi:hypothetical protein
MTDSDRPYSTYESPFDLVLFTLIRTVKMTFNEAKHADIVRQAIAVDPELRPAIVKRTITVEAGTLFMYSPLSPTGVVFILIDALTQQN